MFFPTVPSPTTHPRTRTLTHSYTIGTKGVKQYQECSTASTGALEFRCVRVFPFPPLPSASLSFSLSLFFLSLSLSLFSAGQPVHIRQQSRCEKSLTASPQLAETADYHSPVVCLTSCAPGGVCVELFRNAVSTWLARSHRVPASASRKTTSPLPQNTSRRCLCCSSAENYRLAKTMIYEGAGGLSL